MSEPASMVSLMGVGRVSDASIARAVVDKSPVTLPSDAYGGEPEWFKPPRPVWAWVSWRDRPAERLPVMAYGATSRVVFIRWVGPGGGVDTVVWRNAVTVRPTARSE